MLTFFRKIRKGLLGTGQAMKPASSPVPRETEGKVETYLLYTIGEILLVMIGILLTLQVNNWNSEARLKNKALNENHNHPSAIQQRIQNQSASSRL